MLTLRPDRSAAAGLGHVMRCDSLAAAWERRGRGSTTNWTVIDSYRATLADQRAARAAGRVLVIDDHGSLGHYDADLVLDQNIGASEGDYPKVDARLLLGTRYVMLREQFRQAPITERIGPVLSGGGSPGPATSALLDGLAALGGRRMIGIDDVASFLASATVMVGAAGSTAYECCAVGTPMILFAVADNQVPLGQRLAATGAAIFLGRIEDVTPADVRAALDRADLVAMGRAASRIVDGQGADRVAVQMRSFDVELRPVEPGDRQVVWEWSNDPETRRQSFDAAPIPWDDHVGWFDRQLSDPDRIHYVAAADGRPLGQIRYDVDGDRASVGFSLDPSRRGRGLGAPLLVAGARRLRADRPGITIVGRVRSQNVASARCFELAGYSG